MESKENDKCLLNGMFRKIVIKSIRHWFVLELNFKSSLPNGQGRILEPNNLIYKIYSKVLAILEKLYREHLRWRNWKFLRSCIENVEQGN